jgi:hypothetical protein
MEVTTIFRVLGIMAGLGFSISALAHVVSLFGAPLPLQLTLILHAGIFVVWVPFVLSNLVMHVKKVDVQGYPSWWRPVSRAFFAYFVLHFAIAVGTSVLTGHDTADPSYFPPFVGRLFSAGWMIFYGAASCGFLALSATASRGHLGRDHD